MNRLMIRVSAMDLPKDEFIKRLEKFNNYITDGESTEINLAVIEDRKLNGDKVHLHTHLYVETTYSVENIRKILKDKIFPEDTFRHVKGKGHKPIVIQKAIKDKEMCCKYLLKLDPPEIISRYNVEDEEIKLLTNMWQSIDKKSDVKDNYLKYMSREISETEYAQLSDPLRKRSLRDAYITKVVMLTTDFFVNILEKPFGEDVIEKYTRLWLCKTVPDVRIGIINRVAQSFLEFY